MENHIIQEMIIGQAMEGMQDMEDMEDQDMEDQDMEDMEDIVLMEMDGTMVCIHIIQKEIK